MEPAPIVKMPYGCEGFGRLTRVMLHRPGSELAMVNRWNHRRWLFDRAPNVERFIDEHDRYRELLSSYGVLQMNWLRIRSTILFEIQSNDAQE